MLLAFGADVQLVVTIRVSLGVLMLSGLFPIYDIISSAFKSVTRH